MKKLFGTVGCIQISTLLLVVSASGAFAAARSAGEVCVEVYRSRPCASDVQVDATERLNTRISKTDTATALDELDSESDESGSGVMAIHDVASMPHGRFNVSLHAQRHQTFKLEK